MRFCKKVGTTTVLVLVIAQQCLAIDFGDCVQTSGPTIANTCHCQVLSCLGGTLVMVAQHACTGDSEEPCENLPNDVLVDYDCTGSCPAEGQRWCVTDPTTGVVVVAGGSDCHIAF